MTQVAVIGARQPIPLAAYKTVAPPLFPILYLRHGQHWDDGVYRGISSDSLTPEGVEQSRRIGRYLALYLDLFFPAVKEGGSIQAYTSPLPRTFETTEIIAEVVTKELGLSTQIKPDPRIIEFRTPSPVQGMPIPDLNRLYRGNPMRAGLDLFGLYYFEKMGAETPEEISNRVTSFLSELHLSLYTNGHNSLPRLVVTHGGILQFIKHPSEVSIELIDKNNPNYPYVLRGDGFITMPNADGSFSSRQMRIQRDSRKL